MLFHLIETYSFQLSKLEYIQKLNILSSWKLFSLTKFNEAVLNVEPAFSGLNELLICNLNLFGKSIYPLI